MPARPTLPRIVTTKELAEITAGGDDYIRTKRNVVKGLALRMDLNPDAPDAIVFGKGPRVETRASLLLESGAVVPAYVKRRVNEWEYLGQFRATALRRDPQTIERHRGTRKQGTVAGVLFLESIEEPKILVAGGGFADPATRKEIESAAVAFAIDRLTAEGFEVHDHQRENRGYDLLAKRAGIVKLVEVKGTDAPVPRFFLSRNESKCASANPEWFLYVVCQARSTPQLHVFTAREMRQQFNFDPLAWECIRADS